MNHTKVNEEGVLETQNILGDGGIKNEVVYIKEMKVEKVEDEGSIEIRKDEMDHLKGVKVENCLKLGNNLDDGDNTVDGSLNGLNNTLNEQGKENNQETSDSALFPKIQTDYSQFLISTLPTPTCHVCFQSFDSLSLLREHKLVHMENLYRCNKCDKSYTKIYYLQRHEETHTPKKVYVCKICSQTVVRSEHLKIHLMTHLKQRLFSCLTCNRTFNKVNSLQSHTRKCTGTIVYPCDTCHKTFLREDTFEAHKKIHGNQPKQRIVENLDNIEEYYQVSENIDADNYVEPKVEDVSLNDEESTATEISMADSNFRDCDSSMVKVMEHRENLEWDHMMEMKIEDVLEPKDIILKDGVVKYEVDYVNVKMEETLERENNILEDEGTVENDEMDGLQEVKVEHSLKPGNYLEDEDNTVHESLNGLSNTLNERGTENNQEISDSTLIPKIQTDQFSVPTLSMLTCHICLKSFGTSKALTDHKRIHTEKLYKCDKCDKAYKSKYRLKEHEELHTPKKVYKCKICSKMVMRSNHLKRHLMTHLKQGLFSCTTCNRTFNKPNNLQNHMRKCTGTVVYPCDTCSKTFCREDAFEAHKKTHSNQPKWRTIENLDNIEEYYLVSEDIDADDYVQPKVEDTGLIDEESAVTEISMADRVKIEEMEIEDSVLDDERSVKTEETNRFKEECVNGEPLEIE